MERTQVGLAPQPAIAASPEAATAAPAAPTAAPDAPDTPASPASPAPGPPQHQLLQIADWRVGMGCVLSFESLAMTPVPRAVQCPSYSCQSRPGAASLLWVVPCSASALGHLSCGLYCTSCECRETNHLSAVPFAEEGCVHLQGAHRLLVFKFSVPAMSGVRRLQKGYVRLAAAGCNAASRRWARD